MGYAASKACRNIDLLKHACSHLCGPQILSVRTILIYLLQSIFLGTVLARPGCCLSIVSESMSEREVDGQASNLSGHWHRAGSFICTKGDIAATLGKCQVPPVTLSSPFPAALFLDSLHPGCCGCCPCLWGYPQTTSQPRLTSRL